MSNPTYTNEWFERDAKPLWEKHLLPIRDEIDSYMEIGVAEGASMRWVLEHLNPSVARGIDPYKATKRRSQEAYDNHRKRALANLAEWIGTGQCRVYYYSSDEVLRLKHMNIDDDSMDLILVDGDHGAAEALTDCVLCWPKLKIGGIMVMDDYNRRWHLGKPWSHEAIDAFLMAFEKRYDLLWGSPKCNKTRQIAIRKLRA